MMTTTRRTGTVSAAALSALAAGLTLAHSVAPAWSQQMGLDVWNLPTIRDALRRTDEERAALQARQERVFRQIEAADHLAARLAEGTLTLAAAADQLEPDLASRPGFDTHTRAITPTRTFRQRVARYAVSHVAHLLRDDPPRWAAVSARLEAEYAAIE